MSSSRWSSAALPYFEGHAISTQVAEQAGVWEDRGELVFPWPGDDGRESWRRRSLGDRKSWRQEAGVSPGLWWPFEEPSPGEAGAVLVCEGGPDALAAWSATTASTGDTAERLAGEIAAVVALPSTSVQAGMVVDALAAAGVTDVVLALDGDTSGRNATQKIRTVLRDAGMRVTVLELPDGADLADVLARVPDAGAWLLDALLDAEVPAPPPEPDALPTAEAGRFDGRRYDLGELVASADREPPWRVEPVAVDGHLTLLSAAGGEGKTWAGFAFAGGVAHGATIAGLRCVVGRSVIFDAENGPYVLGSRLGAIDPGLPADRVAVYDAEGLRLNDDRDRAWMLEVIRREGANLVLLDSLRALAPDAAENDSDDMAPIVTGAKTLARQSGAAVILLIHRVHGAADFRGSTAIRDAADLLFVLERVPEDPERRWRRRLRCAKCRVAAEPDDRWIGLKTWNGQVTLAEVEPFGRRADAEPAEAEEEVDALVLAALGEHGPASGTKLAKLVGRQKQRVLSRLRALEEAGSARRVDQRWEAVPRSPEPPGNRPAAAQDGGGSGGEDTPVGGLRPEPPRAEEPSSVPDDLEPLAGGGAW